MSENLKVITFFATLVLVAIYLLFASTKATQEPYFLIGRYLTTIAFTVCFFAIGSPIYLEMTGGFGDFRYLVLGVIFLFPSLAFRNSISARRAKVRDSWIADEPRPEA
jgi:hypothetical protein